MTEKWLKILQLVPSGLDKVLQFTITILAKVHLMNVLFSDILPEIIFFLFFKKALKTLLTLLLNIFKDF